MSSGHGDILVATSAVECEADSHVTPVRGRVRGVENALVNRGAVRVFALQQKGCLGLSYRMFGQVGRFANRAGTWW